MKKDGELLVFQRNNYLTEFFTMIRGMMNGDYPEFVMESRTAARIPAFVFHSVDGDLFEKYLKYLKENFYKSWNTTEFINALFLGYSIHPKRVLITFDDGVENLYSIAYPLLREYGFKAIAFIIPFWIGETGVLNWEQIREMHASGVIDFQSHSFTHEIIPISSEVVDFFNPKHLQYQIWDLPIIRDEAGNPLKKATPYWGMPFYTSSSCLGDRRRYLGDPHLEQKCISYVREHGGKLFFKNAFWKTKLKRVVKKYRKSCVSEDEYETTEDQVSRIRREVELSKKIIESKLPDKKVYAFAYPHHIQGHLTSQILRECGYRIVFGGIGGDVGFGSPDGRFVFINRVNGDFMLRLPGRGRQSLIRLIFSKFWRRICTLPTRKQ